MRKLAMLNGVKTSQRQANTAIARGPNCPTLRNTINCPIAQTVARLRQAHSQRPKHTPLGYQFHNWSKVELTANWLKASSPIRKNSSWIGATKVITFPIIRLRLCQTKNAATPAKIAATAKLSNIPGVCELELVKS